MTIKITDLILLDTIVAKILVENHVVFYATHQCALTINYESRI